MCNFDKRKQIITYVAPSVSLFQTKFALVFGTRHGLSIFADQIFSLYRDGYFTDLIISGGVTVGGEQSEASVMAEALVARGLYRRRMILEEQSTNTGENVAFTREKLQDQLVTELLLIGKVSSKRRYLMTVRRQWPEVRSICCYGVNYFAFPEEQWWRDREFKDRVISECRKIPVYIENGFISEVSIVNGIVQ